jgi:DNA-binding NarL/FixJ family response regulator
MKTPFKIIIVDDNPAFLECLSTMLEREIKYKIIGRFSSGADLLNYPYLGCADLVLLDIEMTGSNGIETAKRIGYKYHLIKLIAITMYQEKVYLEQLIGAGFKGFVNKTEIAEKIVTIMDKVLSNKIVFPNEISI